MAGRAWYGEGGGSAAGAAARAARLRQTRRGLLLLGLLLLAVILWLGWSVIRTATELLSAREDLAWIEGLALDSSAKTLPMLREDLVSLERHLTEARESARPFTWLAPRLGWLPRIGGDVRNAPALLEMGVALASGGRLALDALTPAAEAASTGEGDLLARVLPGVMQAGPELAAADGQLAEAERWRSRISGPLQPELAQLVAKADRILPGARAALQMSRVFPALAGAQAPRAYLILAQNNHELRATGGFISGVGVVRLEGGHIAAIHIVDSYAADNLKLPHPAPPAELTEQTGAEQLLLRDANWWADFPTSAEVARMVYEQDQGVATDGAIAIDMEGVRLLVSAVGPLTVSGIESPVTGDNVIAQMEAAWAVPAGAGGMIDWSKRKDFMGPLMTAALARLQSGGSLQPVRLASALARMLSGRHLQLALDDAEAAQLLAARGWDGALRPPASGDFLAVVDTNTGFNKTNAAVRQEIGYRVDAAPGGPSATLVLTYTHTAAPFSGPCDRTARFGPAYAEMIDRCHWDYLRVYAPGGSRLLAAAGLEEANGEPGELHTTMFSGSFSMRPGEQHVVTLRYLLPQTVIAAGAYRLSVRMQAGIAAPPLHVQAGPCTWDAPLAGDRVFECTRWDQ